MRYAELVFLALLVLYHAVLLVPRRRRPFAANYLVFLAGMALAWNLGLEGLRWQTLPPLALLLIDLLILFPSFATLRGRVPKPGLVSALLGGLRLLVAALGLTVAIGSALLSVAFPLPRVELTGGNSPAQRIVRFPPAENSPGLELEIWYPATGDLRPQPRQIALPETWQKVRNLGGLPVFWQSYLEHLPTPVIVGHRLANPQTKYPVIQVVLPAGQEPSEFAYLFEDLASRGFVVVAGIPLPAALAPLPSFDWFSAQKEVGRPLGDPMVWLEPEKRRATSVTVPDYQWLSATQAALRQLASEPGDTFYGSLDWTRQGLWVWGPGPSLSAKEMRGLGLRGQIRAGAEPGLEEKVARWELWIGEGKALEATSPEGRWALGVPHLHRADLTDAAYLKPYLVLAGLKSQADAGLHGALRQYQAAFFQFALWENGAGASFGQMVPTIPGIVLSGR